MHLTRLHGSQDRLPLVKKIEVVLAEYDKLKAREVRSLLFAAETSCTL